MGRSASATLSCTVALQLGGTGFNVYQPEATHLGDRITADGVTPPLDSPKELARVALQRSAPYLPKHQLCQFFPSHQAP